MKKVLETILIYTVGLPILLIIELFGLFKTIWSLIGLTIVLYFLFLFFSPELPTDKAFGYASSTSLLVGLVGRFKNVFKK